MEIRWCTHCDIDPSQRTDGLCQACATYKRKYRRLPDSEVLRRRVEHRDRRRQHRGH